MFGVLWALGVGPFQRSGGQQAGGTGMSQAQSAEAEDDKEERPDLDSDDKHADQEDNGAGGNVPVAEGAEETVAQMLEEQRAASADDSIWEVVPDTRDNQVAHVALLDILTDIRSAFRFSIEDGTPEAQDLLEKAQNAEQLFYDQETLGTDIKITTENGTFTYNGTTGESGFTTN